MVLGHVALVRDGDILTIDADEKSLNVHLFDEELAERRANCTQRNRVIATARLQSTQLVSSSSIGAITDGF